MAVNAELYLRSSNARLRAPTKERDTATEARPTAPSAASVVRPASLSPASVVRPASPVGLGDAHSRFGFLASADGLPLTVTELPVDDHAPATSLGLVPSLTPTALWQGLLPDLERELGPELRAFRKKMLSARIPADYVNDLFPGRRSGAWAIYRDVRAVEGKGTVEFCLYVRRAKNQLAVWEGVGTPDSLRANFSQAVPGPAPVADDVRRGLAAALVRHRLAGRW